MSDHRITIRLTEAEFNSLRDKARIAGISVAETARSFISVGGEGGANVGQLAEVLGAVIDRLEALESRPADTGQPVADGAVLARIEALEASTERTLSHLIRAVEKLYSAPASPSPSIRVLDTNSPPSTAARPQYKDPAFARWVETQAYISNDETKPERARRLRPIFEEMWESGTLPPL
jgi:hypothetical protein